MKQRTLKQTVTATGVGLHSGERVKLTLHPAAENTGIQFRRSDLSGEQGEIVSLTPYLINDTRLSSTIVTENGIRVGTIEHIMSALAAYGVDNVLIELNAPEIPIMDGSSLPFIFLLQDAEIVEQNEPKRFLRILKEIEIKEPNKWVKFTPYDGFKVSLTIEFDHPVFNRSAPTFEIDFAGKSYVEEIARARTFGFMQEVELMRAHNLGLGGNLSNAIVIDDVDVLNPEGLRYPDEFVRHKILDAIGDLYIMGHPIIGAFQGYKSGHAINNALLRAVLADESAYEWVEFGEEDIGLPSAFFGVDTLKAA
ncbi:UDP-3-O-acyl-N-acetylglucosamine deacetylase [Kingella negevensis]|uniref:UDP-3-O-acyl-N-acetylglucosamine deacetylase n=1 Tax=Kingella negevensis TaxID=1522312 RepID=A0A238HIX2_9NEIS|nr:UDP-3-O-acyl-N-acetylglucosamine deacetylase [Kingella negevensis]MDK4679387.1 UDP-3-O-acyl-N-acetylglucosamine deacetylase [Kingella negevensis]MDK4682894.1 UDP-3-O-acyl-N-acetylglucosamine deacetylase [Kingella negevensis]MDK4685217.1 UDP-3-O-acyl-N-acetylglucosamine deacetylase [Kingella negevensis]MDK4689570.1 UDP-3-O-acyl-N-acetylglucosamine deacetylase [Kingella negevensis]MDK4691092.1 UDP-3-O-acyl-N-acetylglucosamine deacetylase [Kingella negevensis]